MQLKTAREALLNEIETFLARTGMAHTTFGRLCLNDTAFVHRLRSGTDARLDTAERVRKFISEYEAPRPLGRRRSSENVAA